MTRTPGVDRLLYWLGLIVIAWAVLTFLLVPIAAALHAALFRHGGLEILGAVAELAHSRRVQAALWNTIWMTGITIVTVTIVGMFQVAVLEYFRVRGRGFLKIAFSTPLVFGGVVAAAGYNFTYGPGSAVTAALTALFPSIPRDWFIGWFGVLFSHTFLMTSFHFLFLRAAMRRVDYSTIEAARSMGASDITILRRIVLPVIMPTLLAVTLLTLHTAIGSFAAPQVLGGRDFHMLSQMVLTLNSLRRPDMAALLALLMGMVLMGLILLSQYFEAKGVYNAGAKATTNIQLRQIRNPFVGIAVHAMAYLLAATYLVPVAIIVLFSFAPAASIGIQVLPSTFTLDNYAQVLGGGSAFVPFFNSLFMGSVAVVVGLAITLFAVPVMVRKRDRLTQALSITFFLPWIIPSILLAVGLIVAFDAPNPLVGNAVLLGSYWLLPIGYVIFSLPLMVRFMRPAFIGIDPAFEEAARAMGASGSYRFRRVVLPLVAPTAILISGMKFNNLMTEYPLSAFLYNVNNRPLPIAIVDGAVSADPDQAAISLVYVTLVMVFSLTVILIAERLSLGRTPQSSNL
ncbi:ABC transporter permease protein (plasmid) [Rhizobium etli bv. mimosae str. IE4771]|uniref:ABC transporter permease protein n=1 Tax=Rhizobium etli bv. mimosae str. IE4771 TaxID=1432050 RepID=A0A060ICY7_RHIET|nr:iron ABC transporter permease [Rhizobium sp. IE4771]AIC29930.1 ABC transporter permease protein [Rhizobium sp. IE4771]